MKTKNRVSAVIRQGERNYGFSVVVKSSVRNIESALEKAYGTENILICTIKEV